MERVIICGDCIEEMKKMSENSVDAIITDPPYGLEFMGKEWDSFKEKGQGDGWQVAGKPSMEKFEGKNDWHSKPRPAFRGHTLEHWKNMQKFFYKFGMEAIRILKPGGFLLIMGGTRTYHRMTCGIEDAGFEIRDTIMWLYGSGFPKSLNIGKQIDKMNFRFYDKGFQSYCNECRTKKGYSHNKVNELMEVATTGGGFSSSIMGDKQFNELPTLEMYEKLKPILELDNRYDELIKKTEAEREILEKKRVQRNSSSWKTEKGMLAVGEQNFDKTAPATQEAKEWEGWGTALKPACEPIVVARKPLSEKNVALNVLKWGTGGINIDECRIGFLNKTDEDESKGKNQHSKYPNSIMRNPAPHGIYHPDKRPPEDYTAQGRFPANIILDEEAGRMLDEQSGNIKGFNRPNLRNTKYKNDFIDSDYKEIDFGKVNMYDDKGGASRFFYCAKASKSERNFGLDEFEEKPIEGRDKGQDIRNVPYKTRTTPIKNQHPTVKPIKLMEYLIKLVSKENAIVLDPFIGSGTTAVACLKLNRKFIGIEKEEEYVKIANARIKPFLEQEKL